MRADWGDRYLRQLYDELTSKKSEELTEEERHFCYEMYKLEGYWMELEG